MEATMGGVAGVKSYGMEPFESQTAVLRKSLLILIILKFSKENSEENPHF